MGHLHDALARLKAAAGKAYDFADPEAYLLEREHEFKRAVADAFHELEERVERLEREVSTLAEPQTMPVPDADAPATLTDPADPAQAE